MSRILIFQLMAIFLIMIAGYLWSSRLAEQVLAQNVAENEALYQENLDLVKNKVAKMDDSVKLLSYSQNLLKSDNLVFALIPLQRTTEINPKLRDGWYLLGYSYLKLATDKNIKPTKKAEYLLLAKSSLKEAEQIDPSHKPTKNLLKHLEN